jgi:hypothetical protein
MGTHESADVGRGLHAALRGTPDQFEAIARPQANGDPIARRDVVPFQVGLAREPLFVAIEKEADGT